jgi:hypothetical protein
VIRNQRRIRLKPKIANPLYDEWSKLRFEPGKFRADDIEKAYTMRRVLVVKYSWAIPSNEAIAKAVESCPRIVEVGAGRGYWANLLAAAGAEVVAYEPTVEGNQLNGNPWFACPQAYGLYFPVQRGDSTECAKHPEHALFLCWPPYNDPMALRALESYQGNQLLYVGEGAGGCCGDDAFWEKIEREWREEWSCRVPRWPGMNDFMVLYSRQS